MSKPYYVLEIKYPDGKSEAHEIYEGSRILGRSKVKADIQVSDKKASGKHVELNFADGKLMTRDLASTNGTMYGGRKVTQPFLLVPGQSFTVGDTVVRLMAIHGVEQEAARTIVTGAPQWADEEEATRALSGEEIAKLTAAVDGDSGPMVQPEPESRDYSDDGGEYEYAEAGEGADEYEYEYEDEGAGDEGAGDEGAEPEPYDPQPVGDNNWADQAAHGETVQGDPPIEKTAFNPNAAQMLADQYSAKPQQAFRSDGSGPVTMEFTGTGGQLLKKVLLGVLLYIVTAGIYLPWLVVDLHKWRYENFKVKGLPGGNGRLTFHSSGGKFFLVAFVQGFLTLITVGIYHSWASVKLEKFWLENTKFTTDDGSEYQVAFTMTGGALFKFRLVNGLLCLITGFIYMPWALAKYMNFWTGAVNLTQSGRKVEQYQFVGTGGGILWRGWLYGLLMQFTLFIYFAWAKCKMVDYFARNTRVEFNGVTYSGRFEGKGGALFKLNLRGFFFSIFTLNIYQAWWAVESMQFMLHNQVFEEHKEKQE